ncbi:hypothetical protein IEQ34_012823 [Dendrobium chrysotoxum]|uniref:Uncharacterized protein n=1 Tax=Dendrobium chrysotoxum TaxID=161865 RepID=A0AAV7GP90_DENCH|nr:hypothetical protein IEQ34_012823 [Dendrobium chrysotoxum]
MVAVQKVTSAVVEEASLLARWRAGLRWPCAGKVITKKCGFVFVGGGGFCSIGHRRKGRSFGLDKSLVLLVATHIVVKSIRVGGFYLV